LAAVVGALVIGVVVAESVPHDPFALTLIFLAVLPFALFAFVPRFPAIGLVACAVPAASLAHQGADVASAALPAMALVIAVPRTSRRTGIIAAVAAGLAYLVVGAADRDIEWIAIAFGMAAGWFAGASFEALVRQVDDLRAAGVTAADAAVRAERRRLARELHDLVAHALTGTMLCLTEIRLVLDTDRAAALRAVDEAERLARSSLGDLRGTVRLLSEEGDPRLEAPIEFESDVQELLDGYRRSGVNVTATSEGTPLALSVASAWSVYRIVQESLTNAARHAPGADVRVMFRWRGDGITVTVANGLREPGRALPAAGEGSGQGVLGMSERAVLLGGWLEAGPTSSGWTVSAWVPANPHSAMDAR
jgi:signal transduction histidine kinase